MENPNSVARHAPGELPVYAGWCAVTKAPRPSVGRIVHYQPPYDISMMRDLPVMAAVVTSVLPGDNEEMAVLLTVMPPGDDPYPVRRWINFSEESTPDHWSWPPKV